MSEMGKIIMSPPPPPYAPCTRDEVATTMDAGHWDRILFGCKRMGPEEVLGRREVLGSVAIDGALSASADYGPVDFK